MTDFVSKVVEFNEIAGTKAEFNVQKLSLYIGLILEEAQEMIAEVLKHAETTEQKFSIGQLSQMLDGMSGTFKKDLWHDVVAKVDRKEILDAAVDIAVVSIGAGICVGSDIKSALNEVADNNLSKFPLVDGVRTVLKDDNGKVMKPEGYKKPELAQFLL